MPRSFLVVILLLLTSTVFAQHTQRCGHQISAQEKQLQQQFIPGYFGCNFINKHERTLQINAYIVLDSLGAPGFTEDQLNNALVTLNDDFEPSGLQFTICKITYIPNFQYNYFIDVEHEDQMTVEYYEPNTINVYFCFSVTRNGGIVCGYAYFPGGKDFIVLQKGCITDDNHVWSHEMGHFFGLYHTFETDLGVELVNGSNCETAGDIVCDTPADPDPDGNADQNMDCLYTGPTTQDSNGDWYIPPVNNIMSYYPDACVCKFTHQQYIRMIDQFLQFRNYLW
ncbi:MAG: hypothetical protein KDC12_13110 [Flavobacteriales bacterium]|nr:hypothetical protein [Flavobacteriales bacterium]